MYPFRSYNATTMMPNTTNRAYFMGHTLYNVIGFDMIQAVEIHHQRRQSYDCQSGSCPVMAWHDDLAIPYDSTPYDSGHYQAG